MAEPRGPAAHLGKAPENAGTGPTMRQRRDAQQQRATTLPSFQLHPVLGPHLKLYTAAFPRPGLPGLPSLCSSCVSSPSSSPVKKGVVHTCLALSPQLSYLEFRLSFHHLLCAFTYTLAYHASFCPFFLYVHVLYSLVQIPLCESSISNFLQGRN